MVGRRKSQHRVRCRFYHAPDGRQLWQEGSERGVVGVERNQHMAGAGDDVERNVFGGAKGSKGGDEARPLIGLQQDDPARALKLRSLEL